MSANRPKIAFFGTPDFAVWVLDALKERGIMPDVVVAAPDAPKGRKLVMSPPATKVWATTNSIRVVQPESIKGKDAEAFIAELTSLCPTFDLFIVAAYGKIIPESILYFPRRKTINVHPSLLPLFRGPSPLQGAILADDRATGVTIIRLDKEMDHGPILAQKKIETSLWPIDHIALGQMLARDSAELIASIMPELLAGTLLETEQDHSKATYTKKISKQDGQIDLAADPYQNFLKYNAYKGWPGSYFFIEKGSKNIRITITEAVFEDGAFIIKKAIPEGQKEMAWPL